MLRLVKAGRVLSGVPPAQSHSLGAVLVAHMSHLTQKPRLLIVDDEAEVRGVLNDLLCDTYECTEVPSAEAALDQLRGGEFQLVISDITMSGMSGLEMIPHVKAISPDTV